MKLHRPVASSKEIKEGDFGPIDTVEAIRARLDAVLPGGIEWFSERWGGTREIPWAQWTLLLTDDKASVIWVTLKTSYSVPSDERYMLAERVADATGWTAIDLQRGATRRAIVPRAMAPDRSCTG